MSQQDVPTSDEHSRSCWHYISMGDGECDCKPDACPTCGLNEGRPGLHRVLCDDSWHDPQALVGGGWCGDRDCGIPEHNHTPYEPDRVPLSACLCGRGTDIPRGEHGEGCPRRFLHQVGYFIPGDPTIWTGMASFDPLRDTPVFVVHTNDLDEA